MVTWRTILLAPSLLNGPKNWVPKSESEGVLWGKWQQTGSTERFSAIFPFSDNPIMRCQNMEGSSQIGGENLFLGA